MTAVFWVVVVITTISTGNVVGWRVFLGPVVYMNWRDQHRGGAS